METLKNIAAIVGLILSVISLITISTKAGRAGIKSIFKKHTKDIVDANSQQTKDIEDIKESLSKIQSTLGAVQQVSIQQCRDTIKDIYYKYCHQGHIPLYERKTADLTYKIYTDEFHQNTYAKILYNEIVKWEIDPPSPQDINEENV